MRSPVIAFSIIAATVSPTLIAAAPASPIPGFPSPVDSVAHQSIPRQLPPQAAAPVSLISGATGNTAESSGPRQQAKSRSKTQKTDRKNTPRPVERRAYDSDTAGGNAHSGGSANASGGNVANVAEDDTAVPSLTNTGSSTCSYMLCCVPFSIFSCRHCWYRKYQRHG